MASIQIVRGTSEIWDQSPDWKEVQNAKLLSEIVDRKGNPISLDYKGGRYRVISKQERHFSRWEIGQRMLGGIALVVMTLGLALLFKECRELFTKRKSVKLYIKYSPDACSPEELAVSQEQLKKGFSLSQDLVNRVQSCVDKVLNREEDDSIHYYKSQESHRVFSLKEEPNIVFKLSAKSEAKRTREMQNRYQDILKAQTICRVHELGLLVIPKVKMFEVQTEKTQKTYQILAEQKLDFEPDTGLQEQLYLNQAKSLKETINQLGEFICLSGHNDVEWRNNPVLNNPPNDLGQRKIGLIDIEKMNETLGAHSGLFGNKAYKRRGLIGCISSDQASLVFSKALKYGVDLGGFSAAAKKRENELARLKRLEKWYKDQKITKADQFAQVDITKLGLDLEEEAVLNGTDILDSGFKKNMVFKLKDLLIYTLDQIKTNLEDNSNHTSTLRNNRKICVKADTMLKTSQIYFPLFKFFNLGAADDFGESPRLKREGTWMKRILDALVAHKIIHHATFGANNKSLIIQA